MRSMPSNQPSTPTPRPGSITDVMAQVPGLELAHRDWRAMVGMKRPMQVTLWLALQRTVEELESRADGLERLADGEVQSIPAILRLGEVIVQKALGGDMTAAAMIADRIEGRVGTRKGDTDEGALNREQMAGIVEGIIGAYTRHRMDTPDDALDITPVTAEEAQVVRDARVEVDTSVRDAEARRLNEADDSTIVAPAYTNGHGGGLHD
jgi:hypothetical protein